MCSTQTGGSLRSQKTVCPFCSQEDGRRWKQCQNHPDDPGDGKKQSYGEENKKSLNFETRGKQFFLEHTDWEAQNTDFGILRPMFNF